MIKLRYNKFHKERSTSNIFHEEKYQDKLSCTYKRRAYNKLHEQNWFHEEKNQQKSISQREKSISSKFQKEKTTYTKIDEKQKSTYSQFHDEKKLMRKKNENVTSFTKKTPT